ncbi:MAG: glycosyltransferase [Actinobacteria bacterium]|nr:MAG: glycosyltransferase [Actinomycetota bacterium]RIK04021.1 MAG: glycosyl transferase family 2 [Acidobacteriota bacterium]
MASPNAERIDILMITYRSPEYVRRSLPMLLDGCDDAMRVWVWHNGDDRETLEVVRSHVDHPALHRFHHSRENVKLRAPTNWLWSSSDARYFSKVDDDCLLQQGWARELASAHQACEQFGVIGSCRWFEEDLRPELLERKTESFPCGRRILRNPWVQGSGYLVKRECVAAVGMLAPDRSFTQWCIEVALAGFVNGWLVPFVREDHMDDPRSPNTSLRTDEDLQRRLPLSARSRGVATIDDWRAQLQGSALAVQLAPADPRSYRGWRNVVRRARRATRRRGAR